MKIYLATWLEDNQGVTLTKVGYRNRLLSYFFISHANQRFSKQRKLKFDIRMYVKTGVAKFPKRKIKEGGSNGD